MPVTRAEVARAAGVSPSTVTYVLTGERSTSVATRERVLRAVETLGYQPNTAASSLASRSARTVGMLFRMERPGVEAGDLVYVDGVRSRVEAAGLQVFVPMGLRTDARQGLHEIVRSQWIDAAVLMDVSIGDQREELLLAEGVPTVLIGTSGRERGAPSIDADFEQMAALAIDHLAALGHRRVLLLTRSADVETARVYTVQRSYLAEAAAAAGVVGVPVALADVAADGGALVGARGLIEGCTAVISNNPEALGGVVAGARALGLRIPWDLSVISMSAPTPVGGGALVTETGVDASRMGYEAGEMLLRRIADPTYCEHAMRPSLLTDRGTTAAPRPGD